MAASRIAIRRHLITANLYRRGVGCLGILEFISRLISLRRRNEAMILKVFVACVIAITSCKPTTNKESTEIKSDQSGDVSSASGVLSWNDGERMWKIVGGKANFSNAKAMCGEGFRLPLVTELKTATFNFWSKTADRRSGTVKQKAVTFGKKSQTIAIERSDTALVMCVQELETPGPSDSDIANILAGVQDACGEYLTDPQGDCNTVDNINFGNLFKGVDIFPESLEAALTAEMISRSDAPTPEERERDRLDVGQRWALNFGGQIIGYVAETYFVNDEDGSGINFVLDTTGQLVDDWMFVY
jgi:hypothetical protein